MKHANQEQVSQYIISSDISASEAFITESMHFPFPFPQEQRETERACTTDEFTCELSSVVVVVLCEMQ